MQRNVSVRGAVDAMHSLPVAPPDLLGRSWSTSGGQKRKEVDRWRQEARGLIAGRLGLPSDTNLVNAKGITQRGVHQIDDGALAAARRRDRPDPSLAVRVPFRVMPFLFHVVHRLTPMAVTCSEKQVLMAFSRAPRQRIHGSDPLAPRPASSLPLWTVSSAATPW